MFGVAFGAWMVTGCGGGEEPARTAARSSELPPLPSVTEERLAGIDSVVAAYVRERRDAAEARSTDRALLAEYAYALHANGMESDALLIYRRLEAIDPEGGRWALLAARVLRSLSRMDEAIESIRRSASLGFGGGVAQAYLGFWLVERGDLEGARHAFDRALAQPEPVVNARIGRAQVALFEGDVELAMRLLGEARREVPGDRFARYVLGLALRELGDTEGARIELAVGAGSQAAWSQQDPTRADIRQHWVGYRRDYNFGSSLLGAGRIDRAVEVFADLHRRYPDDVPVMAALASAWIAQGRTEEALRMLHGGKERLGEHYALHQALGLAYETSGDLERALVHSEQAVELHPGMVPLLMQFGRQLAAAGRADDAEATYRRAVESNPARTDAAIELARFLLMQGRRADAAQVFGRAIATNPGDAEVVFALAELVAEGGQSAQARQYAEHALRVDPEHVGARRLLNRLR